MKILLFVIFLLISFCKLTFSDELQSEEKQIIAMGDIEYGEYLGAECASCHHQSGASEGIPSIHGMDAEVFVALMLAYRGKEMENPVMQMISGRLNDEQIGSLALYFSGLEPPK